MREQCITFETAKLAKEKGFDEICEFTYNLTEFIPKRKKVLKILSLLLQSTQKILVQHQHNLFFRNG